MTLPHGWLTRDEADALGALARDRTVLELGAWKGRSTVVLAAAARYVVSVDRHRGIPGHDTDSLPDYLSHVRDLNNVAIVVASFDEFVPLLGRFDLVYVDGDHDSGSVLRDTQHALTVRPKVVAFHDWDFAEVRDTATLVLGTDPDTVVGSLAWFSL